MYNVTECCESVVGNHQISAANAYMACEARTDAHHTPAAQTDDTRSAHLMMVLCCFTSRDWNMISIWQVATAPESGDS